MAKRIGEGSLVSTKRTVPGLGIVLKRVKDINEYAGYNLTEEFYFLFDRTHDDYKFSEWDSAIWSKRQEHISKVNLKIVKNKPDLEFGLLDEFWSHNRAYAHTLNTNSVSKPKTDFCLVCWTKAPSDYSATPSVWYKRENRVTVNRPIKHKT